MSLKVPFAASKHQRNVTVLLHVSLIARPLQLQRAGSGHLHRFTCGTGRNVRNSVSSRRDKFTVGAWAAREQKGMAKMWRKVQIHPTFSFVRKHELQRPSLSTHNQAKPCTTTFCMGRTRQNVTCSAAAGGRVWLQTTLTPHKALFDCPSWSLDLRSLEYKVYTGLFLPYILFSARDRCAQWTLYAHKKMKMKRK